MNWSDEPTCKGWWWCFPSPECEWYEKYSLGCVVQVLEDDGYWNADDKIAFTQEEPNPRKPDWSGKPEDITFPHG